MNEGGSGPLCFPYYQVLVPASVPRIKAYAAVRSALQGQWMGNYYRIMGVEFVAKLRCVYLHTARLTCVQ